MQNPLQLLHNTLTLAAAAALLHNQNSSADSKQALVNSIEDTLATLGVLEARQLLDLNPSKTNITNKFQELLR